MKKSILFASGIALAMSFAGCDDGSARINELQAQLDQAKQERDAQSLANQDELNNLGTTYQYKVDSLQWIIDSLTAPKGTVSTKPKPKPTAPTTTTPKTEEPTGNTNTTRGGTTNDGSGNTNTNRGGTTNKTDSTSGNTNQKRGGTNP